MLRNTVLLPLVFVLLIPPNASAQAPQPPSSPATNGSRTCVVEGQVVRGGDLMPLKKAVVTLSGTPMAASSPMGARAAGRPQTTTTNEDGKFCFASVEPGSYQVSAVRIGYVRQSYGQRRLNQPGTTFSLTTGQQISGIVFPLIANAVITGKVIDEDGEPVPGVRIAVLKWGYHGRRKTLVPAGPGNSTNDLGEYRVFALPPGKYYLSASAGSGMIFSGPGFVTTSYSPDRDPSDVAYAPVFFPNTFDPAHATAIEVHGGDEVGGINFRLVPARGVRITGHVAMPGGRKLGMTVNLNGSDGFSFPGVAKFAPVDADGSFEMRGVAPGSYTLVGLANDGGTQYVVREGVEVGNQDIELNIGLHASGELAGRVIIEAAQLTPASARPQRLNVQLQSADPTPMSGGSAQVQPDLSFRMKNIVDGDYEVNVFGLTEDQYVRSIRFEGREAPDTLHVRGQGPLEIVVSPNGGHIDGTVLDDNHQPISRARVVLVPAEEERRARPDSFKTAFTDTSGHYTLRALAPGYYKLFAWENLDDSAYQDPEWLRAYENAGVAVRLDEGARLTEELKIIPVVEQQ